MKTDPRTRLAPEVLPQHLVAAAPPPGSNALPPSGLRPPRRDDGPTVASGGPSEGQGEADSSDCAGHISIKQLPDVLPIRSERIGVERGAVLASALHRALGIRKDFTSWAKRQLGRAMLVQGVDFEVYTQVGENLRGGRPGADWLVTLDGAKHIALMSATPLGALVRRYFIEAERELHHRTLTEYAVVSERLRRLLVERSRLETDGSHAGHVLGSLRRRREENDRARQLQLDLVSAIAPNTMIRMEVEVKP